MKKTQLKGTNILILKQTLKKRPKTLNTRKFSHKSSYKRDRKLVKERKPSVHTPIRPRVNIEVDKYTEICT